MLAAAAGRLTPGELAGLLATPQPGLAAEDGPPRTGFAAIAAGDVTRVVGMVRHVAASPDADAPLAEALPVAASGRPGPARTRRA